MSSLESPESSNELDLLLEFLRFPSISTDPAHAPDMRNCAEWIARLLRSGGLETAIVETAGHPAVIARNTHHLGRRTVLIYGHYDVQPVDSTGTWASDPFDPVVRDGRVYARGATDNKGQILAHILGVLQTIREQGDVPVNLVFLVEGEEEIGSPHLAQVLQQYHQELACDVVAISDTGMVAPGVGTFTYGLRGIGCMEVRVKGPVVDLHSGIFGGSVANPLTVAGRLIASLHDPYGHIIVPGFYDLVRPLEEWEREAWAALPDADAETLALTGVPELFGEPGYTTLERRWARPTIEVNGFGGGFQGRGSKTVIPSEAFFKISCRLVPDQEPTAIQQLVAEHFCRICPTSVRLEVELGHHGAGYLMDPNSRFGLAAQSALRATFGEQTALIREGGSIPIVQTFREVLGAETLLLGLALPDCQAHAPNENFPVENFYAGMRLNRTLMIELAAA